MSSLVRVLLLAASIFASAAMAQSDAPVPVLPDTLSWMSPPHTPGLEAAWMLGAEQKPGAYILRVKLASGAKIAPHTHPDERTTTVLEGTIYVGFGPAFDETKAVAIPTGAVYAVPANVPHHVWAKDGAAMYQEAGVGPTATVFVIATAAGAAAVAGGTAAESADVASLANQVRSAEIAFAKTMAVRDHDAFASHVADEALFFSRKGVLRGKAAVAAGWKSFFEGEKAPFSWEPEVVDVLDSGTLALSSGPVRDPEGKQIGTFNSIWRRETDGRWRVVFDKGCPPCECPPKS